MGSGGICLYTYMRTSVHACLHAYMHACIGLPWKNSSLRFLDVLALGRLLDPKNLPVTSTGCSAASRASFLPCGPSTKPIGWDGLSVYGLGRPSYKQAISYSRVLTITCSTDVLDHTDRANT